MHKISLQKIPGIVIEGPKNEGKFPFVLRARSKGAKKCVHCGGKEIRKRGRKVRVVRHTDFDGRASYLEIHGHRYECKGCSRTFNERYEGIQPRRKYTEMFRKEMVNTHNQGINQTKLSRWKSVGSASIERWYKDFLQVQVNHWKTRNCPTYIGIDEHSFTKKSGYATTLCDLTSNRVFEVLPDMKWETIRQYFNGLPGKDRVEMINMDLSDRFRSIMKELFPKARIVADRFHVIRLVSHHFMKTWQQLDDSTKYHRGLLGVLRKHHWDLTNTQLERLSHYFDVHPEIRPFYEFKQDLCALLLNKSRTKRQCKPLVKQLLSSIELLKSSGFQPLESLAKTLSSWSSEIACMWRYTKTNSITEGFHRKMKLIQRNAYGFKNFENYRLRVLALCGHHDFLLS